MSSSARIAACCRKCSANELGGSVVGFCCSSEEEFMSCTCDSCIAVSSTSSVAISSSDSLRLLICLKVGGCVGVVGCLLVVCSCS